VVSSETSRISGDFISVRVTLKLVLPFKGNKQEFLAFTWNVDNVFAVINPSQEAILYKFVLTRISGERKMAISYRNLQNLADLK
jgi:hypothetical protein